MLDACGHASLASLAPSARIVGLLVANLSVNFENAVVVLHYVINHWPGVRILSICIDIHFDDTVIKRFTDLTEKRARSTMEYQIERLGSNREPFLGGHGMIGLVTLGAVFLAVTGAEAL